MLQPVFPRLFPAAQVGHHHTFGEPREDALQASALPVAGYAFDYPARHHVLRHHHARSQLIYASKGIMQVTTNNGVWITPPLRAIWVPAFTDHEILASNELALRTLYIAEDAAHALSRQCHAIEVSAFLRELILKLVEIRDSAQACQRYHHLAAVLFDEIRDSRTLPLHLPIPTSPRLRRLCEALRQEPESRRTMADWAGIYGLSSRTLARLFLKECGITFGVWLRQMKLLEALTRLSSGEPIGNIAYDLGYSSPSAFSAMFKRTLGKAPTEWLRDDDQAAA